jgi:hypothetical protein
MGIEIVDAVAEEVNELFPPKPGGLVDRYRQKAALERAREDEEKNLAEKIEQPSARAVKVAQQSPEIFALATFTIPAGGYAPILRGDPHRFRATIFVITSAATVILCKDAGAAISGNGATLPYGLPLPVNGRGQLYGYNNTGTTLQVSVVAELYAPERTQ